MLDRQDRFYAPSGGIYPGGPSIWNVIDWDQRRLVSVKMDQEQESPDVAFECLLKHIDHLPPDTYLVHLSPEGDLLSSSNDPEDDETLCPFRPSLDAAQLPPGTMTASRAELQEVARLGPNVDLVVYRNSTRPDDKFAFKYYFLEQHLSLNWHEMCLWCRLKHPNIVPFDKVIVDELEGLFVGFTSKYVPGGTLDENKTRVFKLKWLHQLTDVVDELNLNLGVAHQDVAPRNILIDESSDVLMLFDFNFSARIGRPGYSEPRNDVKGVIFTMYEVITRDKARRDKRHEDQDVSAVQELAWDKHPDVRLDHPVSEFRRVLDEWCERRREGPQITMNTQAPNFIDWPPLPDPPLTEITVDRGPELEPLRKTVKRDYWKRQELLRQGKTVLNWQRPAQKWPETGDKSSGVSDVAKQ
ncbi:hypothetical protein EsDP_00004213 [Epichloe bromicola]|uniref:Protein kinase domain-containing protein n=1 Tax=Epichloe bromicola TaxID=79588 RepID=A0ABQ0CR30_9HYPO